MNFRRRFSPAALKLRVAKLAFSFAPGLCESISAWYGCFTGASKLALVLVDDRVYPERW